MTETARGVYDLIGCVLLLAAVGFAVPGWFTNRPDSAARMRLRLTSWIAVVAGLGMWGASETGQRSWWSIAFLTIWIFWALTRCSHWWQQMEAWRKVERQRPWLTEADR